MRQLCGMVVSEGQDPDVFLAGIYQLRDELTDMREIVSEERITDTVVEGLTKRLQRSTA